MSPTSHDDGSDSCVGRGSALVFIVVIALLVILTFIDSTRM